MKKVILVLLFANVAFAQENKNEIEVKEYRKGAFSIIPQFGYQWMAIENPDGSLSGYEGIVYGISGSVRVLGEAYGGLALGALYQETKSPHRSIAGEELTSRELGLQFEIQYNEFFVATTISDRSVSVANVEKSADYKARALGVGVGYNFSISRSMDLGLSCWYKMGLGRKSENSSLSGTLGDESLGVVLGLRWTPTVGFDVNSY